MVVRLSPPVSTSVMVVLVVVVGSGIVDIGSSGSGGGSDASGGGSDASGYTDILYFQNHHHHLLSLPELKFTTH